MESKMGNLSINAKSSSSSNLAESKSAKDEMIMEMNLMKADLKDKFEDASSYIKEYCDSVRNKMQIQIERQTERFKHLQDAFLDEIQAYEDARITEFDGNKTFKIKMEGYLTEIDDMTNKFELNESAVSQMDLTGLKSRSKMISDELEKEKFKHLLIEFNPSETDFSKSAIGFINFRNMDIKMRSLEEMSSVNLKDICGDFNERRLRVLRLDPTRYLAMDDFKQKVRLVEFNSSGTLLKRVDSLIGANTIKSLKLCKFGSKLLFYVYRINSSETTINSARIKSQFLLLECDMDLNIVQVKELEEPMYCIAANSTNVYCLKKAKLQITVYNSDLKNVQRTIKFEIKDSHVVNRNRNFRYGAVSPGATDLIFHQMEVFNNNLILLASSQLIILNERASGTILEVFSLMIESGFNRIKCLDNNAVLLLSRSQAGATLKVYDLNKKILCEEKKYAGFVDLVIDEDPNGEIALTVDSKLYF
jgi:hypothetical protein